jgi:tetratricopeptide (TPR) repeat protein
MPETPLSPTDAACSQLVRFLDGHRDGLDWLDKHRPALAVFARALDGGPRGRQRLRGLDPAQWDELFEVIGSEELAGRLLRHHPDVHRLFEAAKGDDRALAELKKHKPSYGQVALLVREVNETSLLDAGGPGEKLTGSAAADVGCLIGEMHLEKAEYHKAVEAFSRALENQPTADAFEGRARAYRALAALDEQHARELNGH